MTKVSDFVHKKIVLDVDCSKIKELCLNGEYPELSGLVIPLCNKKEREKLSKNNQIAKEINEQVEKMLNDEEFKEYLKAIEQAEEEKEELLTEWSNKTIKKMHEKNISTEHIADYFNLAPADVKDLLQ